MIVRSTHDAIRHQFQELSTLFPPAHFVRFFWRLWIRNINLSMIWKSIHIGIQNCIETISDVSFVATRVGTKRSDRAASKSGDAVKRMRRLFEPEIEKFYDFSIRCAIPHHAHTLFLGMREHRQTDLILFEVSWIN